MYFNDYFILSNLLRDDSTLKFCSEMPNYIPLSVTCMVEKILLLCQIFIYSRNSKFGIVHVNHMQMLLETAYGDQTNGLCTRAHEKF